MTRSEPLQIHTIKAFDRDLKRLKKKHLDLDPLIDAVFAVAEQNEKQLKVYRDHALNGEWAGFRELHIRPDWLLVYFIDGEELVVVLSRTASHDLLFSSGISKRETGSYLTAPRSVFLP